MKPFPIPVVPFGPGSQAEDETLDYLPMPKDMDVYHQPPLPDAKALAAAPSAHAALEQVVALLERAAQGGEGGSVDVSGLNASELSVINQILAEGEVSAKIGGRPDAAHPDAATTETHVQESVFAGVWRLVVWSQGHVQRDCIEIGPVPRLFHDAAQEGWLDSISVWKDALPPNVVNAPALIAEISDHVATWKPGQPPHVLNLTLLPMTPDDIGFLDHHLGTGSLLVLSRGYGNCRIISTRIQNCWRVVYYNSMEKVILNTVEITGMPEVGMAAIEDLQDSHERLADILSALRDEVAA